MSKKTKDVLLRSDRVLVVALAVILAAASAVVGAAANNRPHTEQIALRPSVVEVVKPVVPAKPVAAAAFVPAVARPSHSATAADLAMAQLLAEHRCLAEVMYYEARGEGQDGQMAVAEVVFHRLRHGHYGHSICAVVYEGAGNSGCQFSFACNGELTETKSAVAWRSSETLAARILTGEVAMRDITGDATHFHAISVAPGWADNMERTVQIGNHVFYKRARSHTL
jgi:spore germination cell wall hydrolase CwlJ-like protein